MPLASRFIYVGNRGTQLFVRALDALAPLAVFTGVPRGLFVSPNGQWIGFVDGTTVLKKVAVTGGPAVTVTTLDGVQPAAPSAFSLSFARRRLQASLIRRQL